MYLSDIDTGAQLTITFEDGRELIGVFEGIIDHMNFYVHCPEIFRDIDEFINKNPTIKFFAGENFYTFTAEIMGKSERKNSMLDTVDILIKTAFKEGAQRKEFRMNVNMKVKIHSYVDSAKTLFLGDWICDALAEDISKSGIRLWADYKLDVPQATLFTLEFSLARDKSYFIPASLMRSQPNTATRSYNYDYGFVFDFSQIPEKQEQLLMDILVSKIKNEI